MFLHKEMTMEKIVPHIKDKMAPKERMAAMNAGEDFDRVPCIPLLGEPSTRLIGAKIREYWHSPQLMAEAEIAAFNRFGHDSLGLGPDAYGIAEAMGANVIFPDDNIPFIEKAYIDDYSRLSSLEPLNPYKDGRIPLFIQACELLREAAGDVVGVGCNVAGPFTIAAYLRGVENILKDVYKEPDEVHELLRLVTESCKNCIDALSVYDIGIGMADPLASGTVIGAKVFNEFVSPYMREIIKRAIEKTGRKPSLHLCGNTYKIWSEIATFDIASFSLDNVVDIGLAREEIGHKVCLMGNVDPSLVIMRGNRNIIFAAVAECLNKAGDNPRGFILSSGCQIPITTPMENVDCFMEAARELGKK
jgi:uroporphyrinogen decarboxylase